MLHGIDVLRPLGGEVSLIARPGGWIGRRRGACFSEGRVPAEHLSGTSVLATSPARTWFDLARTGSLAEAIAAGDSALREGIVELAELSQVVADTTGTRAASRAVRALGHLDARRETALESASWAYFVVHRIPFPSTQVTIELPPSAIPGSPRTARADWEWKSQRLIGECDGRIKYTDRNALYAEKVREDRLRELGYRLIRWGWDDLETPALAAKLRIALA